MPESNGGLRGAGGAGGRWQAKSAVLVSPFQLAACKTNSDARFFMDDLFHA